MWNQAIWALRADAVYMDVALDILERGDPFDMLAVYIGGPDVTGHRFWRYAYPDQFDHSPPKEQIENYGDVIDEYYVYVDHMLGQLIAARAGTDHYCGRVGSRYEEVQPGTRFRRERSTSAHQFRTPLRSAARRIHRDRPRISGGRRGGR